MIFLSGIKSAKIIAGRIDGADGSARFVRVRLVPGLSGRGVFVAETQVGVERELSVTRFSIRLLRAQLFYQILNARRRRFGGISLARDVVRIKT